MDNSTQKSLNLLGLATRAGKLISGEAQVISAIQRKKVSLVICTNDCSQQTAKKLMNKCEYYNVPFLTLFNTVQLSNAIGKKRSICAVSDIGFAKSLLKLNGTISSEE